MRTIEGNVGRDGRNYKHSSHLYSQEKKHGIFLWKSHALRSVDQESAKQEALQSLDSQSVLFVID